MSKKHPDKNEIKTKVSQELRHGRTRSQILVDLENEYYDRDYLVKLVVGTLHPDLKQKYKLYNRALGVLVIALVLFRFLVFKIDYAGSGMSILALMMGLSIFTYEPIAYRLVGTIAIATFLRYLFSFDFNALVIIDLIMTVVVVALSFYLGSRLFPMYGILGPKKDDNGMVVVD